VGPRIGMEVMKRKTSCPMGGVTPTLQLVAKSTELSRFSSEKKSEDKTIPARKTRRGSGGTAPRFPNFSFTLRPCHSPRNVGLAYPPAYTLALGRR
jgi:hypothetical protein